ncbi:MAG TPA: formyltransferase family protein [Steroidobacteraceae bacterium]|nr:formyltransferase family protein [Steroidobacteraceae bacterium]
MISASTPLPVAVLTSHEGTTLQAVLDACAAGRIPARVCLVISNNGDSGALRRARAAAVPARHLSAATLAASGGATGGPPAALDEAFCAALAASGAGLVLLAGYMKPLGPVTLGRFAGRVLNTHPALLPQFGGRGMFGMHVHEAVLAAGEQRSGASIHLVEAEYDTGAVLAQVSVPVQRQDTPRSLAARVQAAERELLVEVLGRIAALSQEAAAGHAAANPANRGLASQGRTGPGERHPGRHAEPAGAARAPEAALAGVAARIAAAGARATAGITS